MSPTSKVTGQCGGISASINTRLRSSPEPTHKLTERNRDHAEFFQSQITTVSPSYNLFISEVRHKSWCEVNEEGTVAAAATSVMGTLTSIQQPQQRFVMKVDRPFFFAIRDNRTGVLLFIGSVTSPS
ncbi:MAG TPA: serpin family protein [Pyrinomonadaceae bacterium]|nr:serpin family protein [Pyrinomonadaceae bacterium]